MATILVVDDSSFSRKLIRKALGEEHTFLEAGDGLQALSLYAAHHPDVVILDLTMPGMHGLEVLQKLKEVDPQARVIVGTADVQEHSVQEALQRGALCVIPKPFTRESLQKVVRDALGEA